MKSALFVCLLACFFVSLSAFAQVGITNPVIVNGVGQPLPGASIAVCSNYPGATLNPPCGEAGNALLTIYTDVTLGTPCTNNPATLALLNGTGCTNPGLSDAYGNALVYGAGAGCNVTNGCWYEVYGSQITSTAYPIIFGYSANVSSVSNSDSTLTISPTTGAVVASLNRAHANTWTALQTFGLNISIGGVTPGTSSTGTGGVVFSASPALTGAPTAPTQTAGDNTTDIATDAFVQANQGTGSASGYTWSGFISNPGSTPIGEYSDFLMPRNITITRFKIVNQVVSGCSTSPVVGLLNQAVTVASFTLAGLGSQDSGPLSVAGVSGNHLAIQVLTAGVGCSGGAWLNAVVTYN